MTDPFLPANGNRKIEVFWNIAVLPAQPAGQATDLLKNLVISRESGKDLRSAAIRYGLLKNTYPPLLPGGLHRCIRQRWETSGERRPYCIKTLQDGHYCIYSFSRDNPAIGFCLKNQPCSSVRRFPGFSWRGVGSRMGSRQHLQRLDWTVFIEPLPLRSGLCISPGIWLWGCNGGFGLREVL